MFFLYAGSFYIRVNAAVTNPLTHISAIKTNITCVCYRYEDRRAWSEGLQFGSSEVSGRTQTQIQLHKQAHKKRIQPHKEAPKTQTHIQLHKQAHKTQTQIQLHKQAHKNTQHTYNYINRHTKTHNTHTIT